MTELASSMCVLKWSQNTCVMEVNMVMPRPFQITVAGGEEQTLRVEQHDGCQPRMAANLNTPTVHRVLGWEIINGWRGQSPPLLHFSHLAGSEEPECCSWDLVDIRPGFWFLPSPCLPGAEQVQAGCMPCRQQLVGSCSLTLLRMGPGWLPFSPFWSSTQTYPAWG